MASSQKLHFIRVRSSVDISFWSALTDKILNEWQTSTGDRTIHGFYGVAKDSIPRINFNVQSFSLNPSHRPGSCWILTGTLKILPNMKSWERFDPSTGLRECAEKIWLDIESERFLSNPQLLSQFVLVAYADVKRYRFHYWFGLPAITPKLNILHLSSEFIDCDSVPEAIECHFTESPNGFFASRLVSNKIVQAKELDAVPSSNGVLFTLIDPTTEKSVPTWLLRNYIAAITLKFESPFLSFLCIKSRHPFIATIESVRVDDVVTSSMPRPAPVGWELNNSSKPGPKFVDLGSMMNPESLSLSSVNLNLRLMKWREFPGLDLDMLNRLKVLILGAGTLGCDVARNLTAWGVCNFTFIDNGTVTFSNPTRQSLYGFGDAAVGNRKKALAAAEAMKSISPSINATGYISTIPMVGHPIDAKAVEDAMADFHLLENCIDNCDVVFLLTDSRESRWLPTVICAAKEKFLINCALGFDTFLVMRHGIQDFDQNKIGCYFCSDVSAPGDSISDRTLDKQCTVTRPGVGSIASALAVEMAVNLLHNPFVEATPTGKMFSLSYDRQESLGFVPHQIRGWLAQFYIAVIKGEAYPKCIGCSQTVISQYKEFGWNFVQEVVNNPQRLEDICEISSLKEVVENIDWDLDREDLPEPGS